MRASTTHRTRWPLWLAAVFVVVLVAAGWWASSDNAVASAPIWPVAPAPAPVVARAPIPAAAKPVQPALSASAFKLIGTVLTADGVGSFAMVRRTADSQLVQLRAGDHVEGLVVSSIEPDSVVLAGASQAIVIEADRTAAVPAPVISRPPPAQQEQPAWAGDPAPFGH